MSDLPVVDVATLRVLFRGLSAFESCFESAGVDVVVDPEGREWHLFDVRYLYEARVHLSPRQRQAIELCLYANIKESDAAEMMGIRPSSPACIYANNGLKKLVAMVEAGRLPKFRADDRVAA